MARVEDLTNRAQAGQAVIDGQEDEIRGLRQVGGGAGVWDFSPGAGAPHFGVFCPSVHKLTFFLLGQ